MNNYVQDYGIIIIYVQWSAITSAILRYDKWLYGCALVRKLSICIHQPNIGWDCTVLLHSGTKHKRESLGSASLYNQTKNIGWHRSNCQT